MTTWVTQDDVTRAEALLAQFERTAGGSHLAMCEAALGIARAGGSGAAEDVLRKMVFRPDRDSDDILAGPWRWLLAVATQAAGRNNHLLVARICWFTYFWSDAVAPTLDRADITETGLLAAPAELRAAIAALGVTSLRRADRHRLVCQDSTGTAVPMNRVIAACANDVMDAQARGVSVDPQAVAQAHAMMSPEAPASAVSTVPVTSHGADLAVLFTRNTSVKDKLKALGQFGAGARSRIKDLSNVADQGAEILSELVARLPIRTLEVLHAEYGGDTESVAQHVIDDAAKLAGWLWTAAAAVPGPPPVVHAIKVIVHSAIEIRMVGELYAIHEDSLTPHDSAWLSTVLTAWSSGRPVAAGGPSVSGLRDVTIKVRRSFADLTSADSRIAGITNRGREGSATVRRLGLRQHRRMRLHPSMWAPANSEATMDMIRQSVTGAILGRIPIPIPGRAPAPDSDATDDSSDPRLCLKQAWQLHYQARAALPVAENRLQTALEAQERHLRHLSSQLRLDVPPIPAQRQGAAEAVGASRYVLSAEDAIDATEDAGAQPRRLASWRPRGRNAFVYAITASVVSLPVTYLLVTSSSWETLALVAGQILILPWLSLAAGALAIGRLFRPWLGGPVRRSPVVGAVVVFAIHAAFAVIAAVLAAAS